MEVLSIGEKIKRARIYKGLTLKDVSGSEISVSKLSCIENGKIMPEEKLLESISIKLDLDLGYLKQDIDDQINTNIRNILINLSSDELIKGLKYNLEAAEKYGYYDLAFSIMHEIFECLLKNDDFKSVQELIGKYYDLRNNCSEKTQKLLYYMDVAKFFYRNKEYVQAANYFSNIRKRLLESDNKDYPVLAETIYGEAVCNVKLKDYTKAYEISKDLNDLFEYVEDKLKKAKMYHMMANLSLRMNSGEFDYYEIKSYEMYEDKSDFKAVAIFKYASTMFNVELKDKAIAYIKKSLETYPEEKMDKLVNFMLLCAEELVKNEIIDEAEDINEDALNYSIKLNNIKFIEKAYYLKSKILKQQDSLMPAEMYMNLSLDALTKFGTKREMYERYMEMGKMYHDIGSDLDSLKYFTLAIALKKNL
jgi:transcriptional regulator with XRE-family HTH domain